MDFWLPFCTVKGNYELWFTAQKPKSYAYGIDTYNGFRWRDIFITYHTLLFSYSKLYHQKHIYLFYSFNIKYINLTQ